MDSAIVHVLQAHLHLNKQGLVNLVRTHASNVQVLQTIAKDANTICLHTRDNALLIAQLEPINLETFVRSVIFHAQIALISFHAGNV